MSLLGAVLPLSSASADQVADKRAQAAKLAAQIDAGNRAVDSLTARFEAAQLTASQVDAKVAASTAALQVTRQRITAARSAVRDMAVAQFIQGGSASNPVTSVLGSGDLRAVNLARMLADVAVSKSQDVLDASKAAQQDYQASLDALHAEQKRAHAAAESLQAARVAAERAVAQQQAVLNNVRGDLATLVAAEQARQRAALEAKNRAAALQNQRPPRPAVQFTRTGPTPAPAVDGNRASRAVEAARQQLGKPYRWGADGPDSFDCSGLTMWAWHAAGVDLPHYTGAQYADTTHISLSELQPGDLVFFYSDLSHVGIYVGGGQMIHAPHTGDVVRYASIYSEGSPIYAGRVTG